MKPIDIRKIPSRELMITWSDDHRSLYGYQHLRFICGCAGCVDELTGRKTLKIEDVPESIEPKEISDVGNYAIRFQWNDGHNTGIYSYDLLRGACQCPECETAKKEKVSE